MKVVFQKNLQLKAPGGDIYEWKKAETKFQIEKKGLYTIKIEASAKNADQNNSSDDDDLRVALDGFDFGKYEKHQEKISWKGFGQSASWNGATLKDGTKTIYYFLKLLKGSHKLEFFADNTPTLKSIEVFEIEKNSFEIKNLKPLENIKNQSKGIPWLSFIFLGNYPRSFILGVNTLSAKTKKITDGDNLKIILNGEILKNKQSPTLKKYKNFYFSGDLKEFDILTISNQELSIPLAFENSIELWYDQQPEIFTLKILFFDTEEFLKNIKSLVDIQSHMTKIIYGIIAYFKITNKPYSTQFLKYSLVKNPAPLIFESNHDLAKKIKKDPNYNKILQKLKEKIGQGILEGEIWPQDLGQINFDSPDLATSLHGIKKIDYEAKNIGKNKFELEFKLFDVYDFQKEDVPPFFPDYKEALKIIIINELDKSEDFGIIKNFEIEINIKTTIYV